MWKRIVVVAVALAVPGAASAGVREDFQTLADAVALAGLDQTAAQIRESVAALSDAELEQVYGEADLAGFGEVFIANADALDAFDEIIAAASPSTAPEMFSPGLPEAIGYPDPFLCPFSPDRMDAGAMIAVVDTIQEARILLESAKGIWFALSRECEEVILGHNTSLACIPSDLVLVAMEFLLGAAEGVVEHIAACDDAVDAAEIEGTYERAGHIHSDLETHDAQIKAQLAAHDADIKMLLGDIQDTVDENQRLIKIFMGRQLEAMRLVITPNGFRVIDEEVLTCTGDNCPVWPAFQMCTNGSLKWNCKM